LSSIFQNRFNLNPSFLSGGGANAGLSVSYEGFKEAADAMRQFAAMLDEQIVGDTIFEVFDEAAGVARQEAPVLTGNLRANIFTEKIGNGAGLHSMAPYSGYVDYGHETRSGSFVPAQPFFSNALAYIYQNLRERIVQKLGAGTLSISRGTGVVGGALGLPFSF